MLSRVSLLRRSTKIYSQGTQYYALATRSFVSKGLQDEKTKEVIEEIKALKYKMESLSKMNSAPYEKIEDEDIEQIYKELSAPITIQPKISNDYLEKLRVKFLDTRNHELEGQKVQAIGEEEEVDSSMVQQEGQKSNMQEYNIKDFENLIYVNALAKRPFEAEESFRLMEKYNISPSTKAINHLMDAYANVNDLENTILTFKKFEQYGLEPDVFTYGSLVKSFVSKNRLDDALVVFDKMKSSSIIPSQPIFSTLMNGCLKSNRVGKAWELFDSMRLSYHQPDEVSFTMMLHACAKRGEVERALNLFEEMAGLGLYPTDVTFNVLINACAKRPDYYQEAFSLLDQMQNNYGFQPDKITFNTLLNACARKRNLAQARNIFEYMWKDMEANGEKSLLKPDQHTFTHLFWCYASFDPSTVTPPSEEHKSSVDALSTERRILPTALPHKGKLVAKEAQWLFNQLEKLDVKINTSLITSYMTLHISQNQFDAATKIYTEKFDEYKLEKDGFAFSQILELCYKTKDDTLAWKVWEDYQEFLEQRSKRFMVKDGSTAIEKKAIESEKEILASKEGWTPSRQQKIAVLMTNTLARANDLKNAVGILSSELRRLPEMKPPRLHYMMPAYNKCIQLEDEEAKRELVRICDKNPRKQGPLKYTRVNTSY